MGSEGARDETAMLVDEASSAEKEAPADIAIDPALSQLNEGVEQDDVGIDSFALAPLATTITTHPVNVHQDFPTEGDRLVQMAANDVVVSTPAAAAAAAAQHPQMTAVSRPSVPAEQPDSDAFEEYGDEDGGIIRCICECDDDDGFTIQCDRCLVWQHCACFGMSQASVPDEYHCEMCNPRPVDVGFAKAHQQKRKEAEARKASIERNIRRHNQSAAEMPAGSNNDDAISHMEEDGADSQKKGQQSGLGGIPRLRKPSQQLDLTNVNLAMLDGPPSAAATPGSARSYKKRGGAPKTGPRKPSIADSMPSIAMTPRTAAMMSSMGNTASTPAAGRADDRMDMDDSIAERMEAWQVEYTPISRNMIAEQSVLTSLTSVMTDYERNVLLKAERGTANRVIVPVVGRKVKMLSQVNPVNAADAIKETSVAEHGLTPIGNECLPVQIESATLSECTQRTYVKLISEMASASIFNALLQVTPLPSEPQRPWSANRIFSKPVMHGLFADVSIPAGCFISEYVGELGSADTYRRDPVNQYQSIGATKPGVHIFPPPLNLCIDARRFGNTTRFARFSCHPNAVLRPVVVKTSQENGRATATPSSSSEPVARFGLFAITDIPRTHEVTLGWEWDDSHIVHLLPLLVRDPTLGMLLPMRRASSKMPLSGNQRLLERERRHAAIAALVEKGEFPYAGLLFSQKMNSILTVLLGSCLCACIGSAPAPSSSHGGGLHSGNSSASSNNMKRQDCAISQMLRLSQGMSLLNVYVPGSSNTTGNRRTKIKAPDFEPLVGKRRWWGPNAMPLTPTSLPDDQREDLKADGREEDDLYRKLRVPYKLLSGGKVGRVEESDFDSAIERRKLNILQGDIGDVGKDGEESEDVDSDDSALTVPLFDSEMDDDDEEDDSLYLEGNNVTIAKMEGGSSYLTHTALPPKKRVSGTRLKAVNSAEENSDVEYKGRKKQRKEGEKDKKDSRSRALVKKKRKKAYEPSSPLTSAPSQEVTESDGSQEEDSQDDTPTPQQQDRTRKSFKREGSIGMMEGGAEAKRRKKGDVKSKQKALLAKKRRQELLGDLDNDSENSSGSEASRMDLEDAPKEKRPTSSSAKKQARKKAIKQVLQSDESEAGEEEISRQNETTLVPLSPIAQTEEAPPVEELPPPPLPPVIEVPKAKLSLAEYRKRLAERRNTNSQSNLSTPLSTPGPPMASPEKMSLPNTPLSAGLGQTAYAFPASNVVAPEATVTPTSTTPTIVKSEFAPPAPRFPRPTTPPREAALESPLPTPPRNVSTGAAPTSTADNSPIAPRTREGQAMSAGSNLRLAPGPPPLPPPASPSRLEAAVGLTKRVLPAVQMVTETASVPTVGVQPMDGDVATSTAPQAQVKTEHASASAPTMQDARSTEASFSSTLSAADARHSASTTSRSNADQTSTGGASFKTTSGVPFHPPRAPRAHLNSGAPVSVTSPPLGPERSTLIVANNGPSETRMERPVPSIGLYENRLQRQASLYQEAAPAALSFRNPSPSRQQPSALVSPISAIGSPYTAIGPASLNDFANVPKGPARMREREREKERDFRDVRERDRMEEREYREPLPPPRDWEQRDRDRGWERERERDYMERDIGYHRNRSHSFDRRRLEEEEEDRINYAPTRSVPPFVPRGGGGGGGGGAASGMGRGGFGPPSVRGGMPWGGRARTRGRGSSRGQYR